MTRLGKAVAALLFLALIGFAMIVRFGSPAPGPSAGPRPPAPPIARSDRLVLPVAGIAASALRDNWGEPRGDGTRAHHAIDIMAPRGTAVLAAAAGTVEKRFLSAAGGTTLYIRAPDGGTVYYYAHLDGYRPGSEEGRRVAAGQPIASIGATGDADPSAPHLHFEIKRMAAGEGWWQGTNVNPYPLLVAKRPE